MAKNTFNEKLHSPGDLPKVQGLSGKPELAHRYGGTKLLVAAPMQYSEPYSEFGISSACNMKGP